MARTAQQLTEIRQPGAYMITRITGSARLTKHLAEMGLLVGKKMTVIQPASGATGLLVYFQGQRLAVSDAIATEIQVQPFGVAEETPTTSLANVPVHRQAVIAQLVGEPALRRRLLDMGLTKGTLVAVHHVAPLGDPIELAVRGYKLSIRRVDAEAVLVAEVGA